MASSRHQALGFRPRRKNEGVGGAVAVEQLGFTVEVADKKHVILQIQLNHLVAQRIERRSFTGDHHQHVGNLFDHPREHPQQEVDVFFEGDPADMGDRRPLGRDAGTGRGNFAHCRRAGPRAANRWGSSPAASGRHIRAALSSIAREGTTTASTSLHWRREKWRAKPSRQRRAAPAAGSGANIPRKRCGNSRPPAAPSLTPDLDAELVGQKRRLDMQDVVGLGLQLRQQRPQFRGRHKTVLRIEGNLPGRNPDQFRLMGTFDLRACHSPARSSGIRGPVWRAHERRSEWRWKHH